MLVAMLQGATAALVVPWGRSMKPAVPPVDVNVGALVAFENTMGLVVVPATAGHVTVAVPLVEP
jgi:hypothetical protein